MNKEEFVGRVKQINSERMIYRVKCSDCITYYREEHHGQIISSVISSGEMDGKEQEFKTVEHAQAAIDLHIINKPLHKPCMLPPLTEYLTHDDKNMTRYRSCEFNDPSIRIHSVDGFHISHNKCAYACKQCGAIFQAKSIHGHTAFSTDQEKCRDCLYLHHKNEQTRYLENMEKVCVCEDLDELQAMNDEREMWRLDVERFINGSIKKAKTLVATYEEEGIEREFARKCIRHMCDLELTLKQARSYFKRSTMPLKPSEKFFKTFIKTGLSAKEQYELFFGLQQFDYWYPKKADVLDKILKDDK